jgi:hypothetical protein
MKDAKNNNNNLTLQFSTKKNKYIYRYKGKWGPYKVNGLLYQLLWSVLLVEETGVPGENHRPVANHGQTLSDNVVSSTPHLEQDSNS